MEPSWDIDGNMKTWKYGWILLKLVGT